MHGAECIARAYLVAMEARDLAIAAEYLAPEAELVFPGGRVLKGVEGIAANSGGRYARIGKHIDGVDLVETPEGTVVYLRGRLHGEWSDGGAFENIRFIDRFLVRDGRIVSQQVWNDAGEARLARGAGA